MQILDESSSMAKDAIKHTNEIIKNYPERLCGSRDCNGCAQYLKTEFSKHCDMAVLEKFNHRPESMLGFMKVLAITYTIATILLFFNIDWLVLISMGLYSFGIIFSVCQFVLYLTTFDFMFRNKQGYNVVGTIEPENNPPKQQIIISGHHDAAHVFNFFYNTQKWYSQRIIIGLSFVFLMDILSWIWGSYWIVFGKPPSWFDFYKFIGAAGLLFTIPFFWFVSPKISPGAGDNLISSALTLEVAKKFNKAKKEGKSLVKNTRLIFVSFDAEEAGLRGSKAYALRHKKELTEIPTYMFNFDSIYEVDEMNLATSEINGVVKNSEILADEIIAIGNELGYKLGKFPMVFGGGGTDAGSLSQIGIEATTLVAMSVEAHGREGLVYHTPDDTVEHIEPECVEACINLAYNFIIKKDALID